MQYEHTFCVVWPEQPSQLNHKGESTVDLPKQRSWRQIILIWDELLPDWHFICRERLCLRLNPSGWVLLDTVYNLV